MGLLTFSIYGKNVQDAGDEEIPADVSAKILRFVRAGLALTTMKDKSYLSIGSVSMGIAGSVVDPSFFNDYLGMRNEFVDMSEISRRIEEGIYDPEEYKRALSWVKANCVEGEDVDAEKVKWTREKLDQDWEFVVKMTLIARGLMIGNPRLKEIGFGEEAEGRNAIAAGFQGQRQWTDYRPNGDFLETILNSSLLKNVIRAMEDQMLQFNTDKN